MDYYNSFVIQPFLLALTEVLAAQQPAWAAMVPAIQARAQRYASIQERLIAPDGTYPIVGRSITYRCGAFQLLAEVALRRTLAPALTPEQVRCALTAVIHRTLAPKNTFDSAGWLRIGLAGHQPSLDETYISTGSLYLCTAVFLPLGLPAKDRFWSGEARHEPINNCGKAQTCLQTMPRITLEQRANALLQLRLLEVMEARSTNSG